MAIACMIRCEIDPFQKRRVPAVRSELGPHHPRCGGQLVGYFLPHEGTNNVAWGLIAFESLAAYEAREERTFVEVVDGTVRGVTV
jgi:hypothetical protein